MKMEFYLLNFAMMFFFFLMAACIHKFKPNYGHQTSFTLIIGVVVAISLWCVFGDTRTSVYKFDSGVFFDFLLPPLMLNSGFNMRRKSFFSNMGNITIFGIGVTIACFVIYSFFSYLAIKYGNL
jgi:sodium/hydrogen exchanger-like protein 6/7